MDGEKTYTLPEAHALFARKLNGEVWSLLDKKERTRDEDERMLHAAHASLYHWLHAGTAVNRQRGEWMIARVHTVLGNGESALQHARRCMELTEAHRDEMKDFDLAFAEECQARANALAGHAEAARKHLTIARELGDAIADQEDRKAFFGDLEGGDWFGIA